MSRNATVGVHKSDHPAKEFGLNSGALGPVETLAQSVSAMAPSTSASLTIPLVFALAGNATWFVYLLATGAILLVGFCVSRFARMWASPGSLYTYTASTLPPFFGMLAACALLLAYLGTGASVAGGALYYFDLFAHQLFHSTPPAVPSLAVVCIVAGLIAYRDITLSAELMLWIEILSVSLVVIVLVVLPFRIGLHPDIDQFRMRGVSFSTLGPALVLSIFSFAGFEAATTLGGEAREPLRTIPRAVLQCGILAGVFFMMCSYAEVLGFKGEITRLSDTTSPLHMLAAKAGFSPLGVAIDFGAMVSMFACVLACITAAARVLMGMARDGIMPAALERVSPKHKTPVAAISVSAALMLIGTSAIAISGYSGSQIYDLSGSLAVFGFLTAYALVCVALPFAGDSRDKRSLAVTIASFAAAAVMVMVAVFDIRSASDPAHARIPSLFLVYIAAGSCWYFLRQVKPSGAR